MLTYMKALFWQMKVTKVMEGHIKPTNFDINVYEC